MLELYRAAGEPPFQRSDFELLETIGGFVAHAMTRAPTTEDAFAGSEDQGLIVADLSGKLLRADRHAHHLLQMALGLRLKSWSPAN